MTLQALVISDSAVSRSNAQRALAGAGFDSLLVRSEDDVARALDAHRFSLLVVALPEPPRLSLLRRLRGAAGTVGVPILALVDCSEVGPRVQAIQAGARDCVAEPYDPGFLASCAASLHAGGSARRRRRAPGPGRVLVVDDSATYSSALAEELRRDGHDVVLARGAADAMELLALEPVDEVVVDVFMPDVSGVELCERIRAHAGTAGVPILMLTGRKDTTLRETGLAAGADDFVVKSGDFETIRTHVAQLLLRAIPTSRPPRTRPTPVNGTPRPTPPSGTAAPPTSTRPASFVDRVAAASGLSPLIGRTCVMRACARAGVPPEQLGPANLDMVLPFLVETLHVFADPGEQAAREQAIADLADIRLPASGRREEA
jgi:DNA-binding response OmpR family regulator